MTAECLGVVFTSQEQAELQPVDISGEPAPDQIAGRTLVTLISAGTELAVYQNQLTGAAGWPRYPGYAAVFEVEQIGEDVEGVSTGELRLCMGGHRSTQLKKVSETISVPKGLAAEKAAFARMMGVSTTTLTTTTARPGELVVVTGLGPVGLLCAMMFKHCGYRVIGIDPDDGRREFASDRGIKTVLASMPLEDEKVVGHVALVVECSGHEQATLDACKIVQQRGEVVLVGVPWKKNVDMSAHEILDAVFHKYAVLRSGWEWELPAHPVHFQEHSCWGNLEMAMGWLADGSIDVEGLGILLDPSNIQQIYQDLLNRRTKSLSALLDWRKLG